MIYDRLMDFSIKILQHLVLQSLKNGIKILYQPLRRRSDYSHFQNAQFRKNPKHHLSCSSLKIWHMKPPAKQSPFYLYLCIP